MGTYEDLRQGYLKLFKDQTDRFKLYPEGISLLDLMIQEVTLKRNEEFEKTKEHVTGSPAITHFYLLVIRDSFMAHHHLMKSGVVRPSFSHLRTIYETIMKTYLCKIDPEIGEINYKYEIRESQGISAEEKELIEIKMNRMKYLGMSYVEPKLYEEETRKKSREFYHQICNLVHPSIKSLASSFELHEEVFLDSAKLGMCLLPSAFALTFEIHWDYIEPSYKKRFLNMMEKFISLSPRGVADFFPEKQVSRLRFQSCDDLIHELKKL